MTRSLFGKFVAFYPRDPHAISSTRGFACNWRASALDPMYRQEKLTLYIHVAALFLVVATGQMAIWALKKHKTYKREFGDKYPRGRKAMIPFIF